MVKLYIPDRGDIVWLDFNPQLGREQYGHRPAFVISPIAYNQRSNLALLCPITSKIKEWKFEVLLTDTKTKGVILADQIKSLDWQARKISFIERASNNTIEEVIAKIETLLN
ncbi:endoribonuclease MazF [Pseudanabaena mucicola]|uniref:Endoribonuclease MazF n=1 Tax=Pseudanabaena mucicola FACHB-723 TaxID=2692860 RepID=A0ABR7ZYK0_9CYAN|nr:endoribonuclease MazF [Pseudanabaena mucicola]MBD2189086.1 endoribonuclease MazF [Pseudanabaena mucicola FACHB-723]